MSIEVALFGILGRDAELKTSRNGKEYVRLNIRCGDGDGAQWVSAMVFDADAIALVDKLVRGARVYLEGSITLNEWTGQDGAKRTGLSVMSWHCRLAAIGSSKRERKDDPAGISVAGGTFGRADRGGDLDDPIPFAPEWR